MRGTVVLPYMSVRVCVCHMYLFYTENQLMFSFYDVFYMYMYIVWILLKSFVQMLW